MISSLCLYISSDIVCTIISFEFTTTTRSCAAAVATAVHPTRLILIQCLPMGNRLVELLSKIIISNDLSHSCRLSFSSFHRPFFSLSFHPFLIHCVMCVPSFMNTLSIRISSSIIDACVFLEIYLFIKLYFYASKRDIELATNTHLRT